MRIDRQDLYALLRARNIPYEETAHPAVWSMEELHALCLPGEERILKNLFLQDDKKRRYYLVAIDGGRTADLKALRRTLDSRPLRFADAADLERLLGLLPGQVTPLGALRAPAGTVTVVLDASLRGRTLQSVVSQYLTTVKPMHEQYVEPSRKYADIVVLEGGHNLVALDMIMQRIQHHIDGK